MSSVKSLLRKLINEEIDKLDEQASALASKLRYLKSIENKIKTSPDYWKAACKNDSKMRRKSQCFQVAGRLKQLLKKGSRHALDNFPTAFKILHPDTQKELLALAKEVKPKDPVQQTANFCANPDNDNKDVPGLKGFRCSGKRAVATTPEAAKAAGAKAGGKGTGSGTGRSKNTKKTRGITMLIQRKLNDFANVAGVRGLKPTRRAKDGADGILGTGTLALIKKVLGNIPQLKNKWVARRNAAKINKMLSDKYEKENIASKVGADPAKAAPAAAPKGARQPPAGADPSTAAAWPD